MANSNAGKNPSMNLFCPSRICASHFRNCLGPKKLRRKPEKFQSTVGRLTQVLFFRRWGRIPNERAAHQDIPRPANGRNNKVAQKVPKIFTFFYFFFHFSFFPPRARTFPLPYLNFKSRHIFYTFSFDILSVSFADGRTPVGRSRHTPQ